MKCHQCQTEIDPGEEKEHRSLLLCEDCYMEALSPPKACDPWAVYSAKSLEQPVGGNQPMRVRASAANSSSCRSASARA